VARTGSLLETLGPLDRFLERDPIGIEELKLLDAELKAADDPKLLVAVERAELHDILERFEPTSAGLDAI
jgi:hypothetical protein